MKPIIKWPGGKSSEIKKFENLIPNYDRYVEPFFGGGALYFHLQPKNAVINDISTELTSFYSLVKRQDPEFHSILRSFQTSIAQVQTICREHLVEMNAFLNGCTVELDIRQHVEEGIEQLSPSLLHCFDKKLLLDGDEFLIILSSAVCDKLRRIQKLCKQSPFCQDDVNEGIVTAYMIGYYTYFRKVYNDINLGRIPCPSVAYKIALFYFLREYCYGSMFRYNATGEFNIPYGGKTYNKKSFGAKIDSIFNEDIEELLQGTTIFNTDFRDLLNQIELNERDFIFLDPPYDTEFSDYEGRSFDRKDQMDLADFLRKTKAKFILVIKNTEFISGLYKDGFNIVPFENEYSYNVKSRNNRSVEHLIITNIPV